HRPVARLGQPGAGAGVERCGGRARRGGRAHAPAGADDHRPRDLERRRPRARPVGGARRPVSPPGTGDSVGSVGVVPQRVVRPVRQFAFRWGGGAMRRLADFAADWASVGPESPRAAAFGTFGPGSMLRYPLGAVYNERYVHIGAGTLIGPDVALAAG